MMKNKSNISICIVNWNTKEDLRVCLESIRSCSMDLETIVCDNASSDGSSDMVRRDFPEAVLISNQKNIGFGKANNLCFQKCSREYVLIANPDIIVDNNALENLKGVLENDSSIGAVGALLVDGDRVPQKHYYRKFPSLLQHMIFQKLKSFLYMLLVELDQLEDIIQEQCR